jgi:methyl-accepting chemotaxis protein
MNLPRGNGQDGQGVLVDLRRKISLSFVVVGAVATLLSSWTILSAVQSRSQVAHYRDRVASVQQAVARLRSDFLGYDDQMNMVTLVVATSPDQTQLIKDTYAQAMESRAAFATDLAAARRQADDSELRSALELASADMTGYEGFAKTTWSHIQAGRIAQASKATTVDNASVSNALTDALTSASRRADTLAGAALSDLNGRQAQVLAAGILLAGSILALLVGIWVFINRSLSAVVKEVLATTDQLAHASRQISSASESLSQAATEQAASVEETSASIEQMAASISQNSDNAKVTDGIAAKAATEAGEGGTAVQQTVQAMKTIASKIAIIDDIAFQTNMLALNATIEAARAGEHGKGFAVVATEVGKLAERSQVAAQQIGELASASVHTAEQAGALLEEIVPSIQRTSDLVQEIAAASAEQTAGVSQINKAMSQMNQVTQQNASASEELAATSEEMSSQTSNLQHMMRRFMKPSRRMEDFRPAKRGTGRGARTVTADAADGQAKISSRVPPQSRRPHAGHALDETKFERF